MDEARRFWWVLLGLLVWGCFPEEHVTQNGFTPGQWTWVPLSATHCGDGSTTGIGVNTQGGKNQLLIYFEGGGACWDYNTCFVLQTASNLQGGYGQAELGGGVFGNGLFNREDPGNPFKDYTFVYLPYCTGDVHSGSQVTTYVGDAGATQIHHVGYTNVTAELDYLTSVFPGVKSLVVAGTSAGGYGALFNYKRAAAAFPDATPYVVADSSPPLRPPYFTVAWYQAQAKAWGNVGNLPQGCTGCSPFDPGGGMFNMITLLAKDPGFRGSLLGSTQDLVISYFGSLAPGNPQDLCAPGYSCEYQAGMLDLMSAVIEPAKPGQMRTYLLDSSVHGLLGTMSTVTTQTGVQLESFLQDQVGQGTFSSAGP
jgi:hypothetical protein